MTHIEEIFLLLAVSNFACKYPRQFKNQIHWSVWYLMGSKKWISQALGRKNHDYSHGIGKRISGSMRNGFRLSLTNWTKDHFAFLCHPTQDSRLPGEISTTQICRWYHSNGRKQRETKQLSDECERGEWKIWLKTQHWKNWDYDIWSHHFMTNRRGKSGSSDRFYSGGLQNHCKWYLQPRN